MENCIVVKRNWSYNPHTCQSESCLVNLLALWAVRKIEQSRDDEMTVCFNRQQEGKMTPMEKLEELKQELKRDRTWQLVQKLMRGTRVEDGGAGGGGCGEDGEERGGDVEAVSGMLVWTWEWEQSASWICSCCGSWSCCS
ncbi:hypothetical protein OS493_039376 [Desmophyllum pertusum]|uniref:Uncharacterized protein n=1 Tax=Desmophyllum pertusum TaxID=174260 RepID=A0A9W9ZUN4_9CNID|nr:hypothetical protein OS493_039376 [Desmophyllum pertusum]